MRRGNWAGFSSPGRETLSSCLSSASLANTGCWPCWISPAKDDACLCWVRAAFQTPLNKHIFTFCFFWQLLAFILAVLLARLDTRSSYTSLPSHTVRDPEGELKLYTKGADLVILERLQRGYTNQERIEAALEVSSQIFLF